MESDIRKYGALKYGTEVQTLQEVTTFTRNLLIIELIEVATLFVLGIVLLATERGLDDGMPRPKSRHLGITILITSCVHLLTEFAAAVHLFSFKEMIFPLVWVGILVIFCLLGLRETDNMKIVNYTIGEENLSASERSMLKKIKQEERLVQDWQIATLRKKVLQRKLEKELQQIDLEERALRICEDGLVATETEQLKKELTELE